MLKRKNKNEPLHFVARKHTRLGIGSAVIGIIMIIIFIALSILSSRSKGNAGIFIGFAGLLMLAISVFGLRLSYKAFHERDIFYRFPIIGAVSNGLMIILLLILYVYGISL
ncbi:MAG: hypothetical protein GX288_05795 [Clostridiales bacterium]|nr:hypothetical protein [Clostridiales bacterium]